MRWFALLLVVLGGTGAYAQNGGGSLQGVYGPPESAPGRLRGVYQPPQAPPLPTLPSKVTAPDYGTTEHGPIVSMPGDVQVGQTLPEGVSPSPIPDRPGYGRAEINGRPAIVDMGTNRIVEYSK